MAAVPPGGDSHIPPQSGQTVRAHNVDLGERIASARRRPPRRRTAVHRPAGYALVLVGALVFVVGAFLPYYGISFTSSDTTGTSSLWQAIVEARRTALGRAGGFLYLFGGIAIVASLAVSEIQRPTGRMRPVLAAAVGVWAAAWVGSLTTDGFPGGHKLGFWVIVIGVGIVLVGTLKVWLDRPVTPEAASPDVA